MRITLTGATGLIGSAVVARLKERGDEVTVLSRNPEKAGEKLGVDAVKWDAEHEPAPVDALEGRDAVINLAGEPVAQRWNEETKTSIRSSRIVGTQNLLAGIDASEQSPKVLINASAIGYYGPRDDTKLDEDAPYGDDFLAEVCVEWEAEALKAQQLGLRVVLVRSGVVLSSDGGALKQMLTPFKLGVGGPIGSGDFYMSWIHLDDEVGIILAALDGEQWSGPINATAPEPATNKVFSKALGRVLHRPAFMPVPPPVLKLAYGEMSEIVTKGQRVVPRQALEFGYSFKFTEIEPALSAALDRQ